MDPVAPVSATGVFHDATLRCGVASLTATAGRARFNQHSRHARKDAR
ncbi:DUF6380 family protein [Streptomyces sp. NPDC047028]